MGTKSLILILALDDDQVPALYADLTKIQSEEFEIRIGKSASDAVQIVASEPAIILFMVKSKNDILEIVELFRALTDRIKENSIKIAGFELTGHPKITNFLKKNGVAELFEQNLNNKSLLFKLKLWNKAISSSVAKLGRNASFLKNQQKGPKLSETTTSSTAGKGQIYYMEPLALSSDCWIQKKKSDMKYVMGSWMMEFVGPGPSAGFWKEIENTANAKEISWKWTPIREEMFQIITDPGFWVFQGRKPEFDWEKNVWKFIGELPSLVFYDDAPIAYRFQIEDGNCIVSENSRVALDKLPMLKETFDPKFQFTSEVTASSLKGDVDTSELASGLLRGEGSVDNLTNDPLMAELAKEQESGPMKSKKTSKVDLNLETSTKDEDDEEGSIQNEIDTFYKHDVAKFTELDLDKSDDPLDAGGVNKGEKERELREKSNVNPISKNGLLNPDATSGSEAKKRELANKKGPLLKLNDANINDKESANSPNNAQAKNRSHNAAFLNGLKKETISLPTKGASQAASSEDFDNLLDDFDLDVDIDLDPSAKESEDDQVKKLQERVRHLSQRKALEEKERAARLAKEIEDAKNAPIDDEEGGSGHKSSNFDEDGLVANMNLSDLLESDEEGISKTNSITKEMRGRSFTSKTKEDDLAGEGSKAEDIDKYLRGGAAKKEGPTNEYGTWGGPRGRESELKGLGDRSPFMSGQAGEGKEKDESDKKRSALSLSPTSKNSSLMSMQELEEHLDKKIGDDESAEPTAKESDEIDYAGKKISLADIKIGIDLKIKSKGSQVFDLKYKTFLADVMSPYIVLEHPENLCAIKQSVVLTIDVRYGMKNLYFELMGIIEEVSESDEGGALLTIQLTKFEEKNLDNLTSVYAERQQHILNFFQAARGQ